MRAGHPGRVDFTCKRHRTSESIMRRSLSLVTAAATFLLAGCYHAVLDTGRAPSNVVIRKPWVNSFVYGLVAPPVMQAAQECAGGVAKVETQHSLLNGLVAGVTWGIHTPMSVAVTCASASAVLPGAPALHVGAEAAGAAATFDRAIELAGRTSAPVYIRF
jgi:hypothetical protein